MTASMIGGILGDNPYENYESMLNRKSGLESFKGNKYTRHGNKFEEIATICYQDRTNSKVEEYGLITHQNYPLIGASPDGITTDGIMLEIKCPFTRELKTEGYNNGLGVPDYYWDQVQIQLEVCNLEYCDFEQCKIESYHDYSCFKEDSGDKDWLTEDGFEKGVLIELGLKPTLCCDMDEEQQFEWKTFFYPPKVRMTNSERNDWIDKTMCEIKSQIKKGKLKTKNGRLYKSQNIHIEVEYWFLTNYTCVRIKRDRDWFIQSFPKLINFWRDYLFHKNNKAKFLKSYRDHKELKKTYSELEMTLHSYECFDCGKKYKDNCKDIEKHKIKLAEEKKKNQKNYI